MAAITDSLFWGDPKLTLQKVTGRKFQQPQGQNILWQSTLTLGLLIQATFPGRFTESEKLNLFDYDELVLDLS